MKSALNPWMKLGWESWALGLEAGAVIGLRTMKIAAGGAAGEAEARRMVTEKVDAMTELGTMAMVGGLGCTPVDALDKTLSHYRKKVTANRHRLVKV